MIIVNTETIPGHPVREVKGLVQGNTIRAKHLGRDIAAVAPASRCRVPLAARLPVRSLRWAHGAFALAGNHVFGGVASVSGAASAGVAAVRARSD
ncbi:MAG: heavy metal-binding domain-containing protein [Phycisphaerae bacterium]|nr:heavy metal-binding domain-containing protein [Phycisphaerae bacterium]